MLHGEEAIYSAEIVRAGASFWVFAVLISSLLGMASLLFGGVLFICFIFVVMDMNNTDLVVTNMRVIGKRGLFTKKVVDLPLNGIETINSKELRSKYGDIETKGVGNNKIKLKGLSPVQYRIQSLLAA